MSRYRAWRLQRAEDQWLDARAYLDKWGFARTPSELRKLNLRVAKLESRYERLRAEASS